MVNYLIAKFRNIILSRLYTNTKIIIYRYLPGQTIPAKLTLQKVNEKNIDDTKAFEDKNSFSVNRKNSKNGDSGIYGYYKGACVFRAWVSVGSKKILFHKFYPYQLRDDEVYIHSCLTNPVYRGRSFYSYAISEIALEYYKTGKTVLISTDKENIPSKKGILQAGFKEISEVTIKIFLGSKKITVNESK